MWDGCLRSKTLRPTRFLDIKAKKPGEGILRPNGNLDIKAEKPGEGVLRPNGNLDIKAEKFSALKFLT